MRRVPLLGLVVLLLAPHAHACPVEMSVERMADLSGQVVIARVDGAHSYWAADPSRIETELTFSQTSYLKGAHTGADDRYSLVVPGGTVGDTTMRLCCEPAFDVGDEVLLFVLPEYRTYPTVGMSNGAFEIVRDEQGVARVFGTNGEPVIGIDESGHVLLGSPVTPTRSTDATTRLRASSGLTVRAVEREAGEPMLLDDFLAQVRPVLDASTDHRMIEQAGRRVPVEYIPTRLRLAPGAVDPGVADARLRTTDGQDADRTLRRVTGGER